MGADRAKGVLEGIVISVCRELKLNPKDFRTKPAGSMLASGLPGWYVTVQNPASAKKRNRNSRRAKRAGLIKTHFIICRDDPDGHFILRIQEWDASKDWMQGERILFELPADDMKSRTLMAEQLKSKIIQSLGRGQASISPVTAPLPLKS